MAVDRVKFQDIVASQLPRFVREDFPLLSDFMEQYYVSQEHQGGTYDLLQNIDQYVKVDQLYNLTSSTLLEEDIGFTSNIISTAQPGATGITTTTGGVLISDVRYLENDGCYTEGFPETNGIIQINDEIITYEYKTSTQFVNCTRGFCGITSFTNINNPEELVFSTSSASPHNKGDVIYNLNIIFLQEFFKKIKAQFTPGFDDRTLYPGLDKRNFIYGVDSFYSSKGTDSSFKILFQSLYGKDVEIVHPSKFLFRPSDADYKVTKDIVVESFQGDPLELNNLTLFQDSTGAKGSVANVRKVLYNSKVGAGSTTAEFVEPEHDSQYYQVSLDIIEESAAVDDFKPNPKTKLLTDIIYDSTSNNNIIDVDSTVGFPDTGYLVVKDVNGDVVTLGYSGKTVNQFLNVTGITISISLCNKKSDISLDDYAYAYVGINTSTQIKVRVTNTLKSLKLDSKTYRYNAKDTIKVQSLGIEASGVQDSAWWVNNQPYWDVKAIRAVDVSTYEVDTHVIQTFLPGDKITITTNDTSPVDGTVILINSNFTFRIKCSDNVDISSPNLYYKIQKDLLKVDSDWSGSTEITGFSSFRGYELEGAGPGFSTVFGLTLTPVINDYNANILNAYAKFDGDVLVATNSIPKYVDDSGQDIPTNPYTKALVYSGSPYDATGTGYNDTLQLTRSVDHGFYTGDAIFYNPGISTSTLSLDVYSNLNYTDDDGQGILPSSVYYVRRVDGQNIKISRSRSDLFAGSFVNFVGIVTNTFFTYSQFYQKEFIPQPIYRNISSPSRKGGVYKTDPGHIGILNNGVEVINYKSSDNVFYGPIESVVVGKGGWGYDVINPPLFHIDDNIFGVSNTGTGATGICAVKGQLERINIIDSGLDYIGTPSIEIGGGNGQGASAEVNMASIIHSSSFVAQGTVGVGKTSPDLNIANDTIGFSTFHKFSSLEKVIYQSLGLTGVGGLSTDATYYVQKVDNYNIKLHDTLSDATLGIGTINITSYGSGVQKIRSFSRKRIVSNIIVSNSGSGYQNKQRSIVEVKTSNNRIYIKNHGYLSGEIVQYSAGSNPLGELSTTAKYYVKKIDNDNFSLSLVGSGNTSSRYYYDNDIIVGYAATGDGSFNYEPITVEVKGVVGIGTTSGDGQDFNCKVQPIFRGSIDSVDITSGGIGYGASEVLNFNRQPVITFKSGKNAQLQPIIGNGEIVGIIIRNGGTEYNSPPDLIVESPEGKNARLTPIITDGVITDVKIINGGIGFTLDTTIIKVEAVPDVDASEGQATIIVNSKRWNVDLFQKNYNDGNSLGLIKSDDGFLTNNITNSSLQYGCLYIPRALRRHSYSVSEAGNVVFGSPDLRTVDLTVIDGREVDSLQHSPILGWAYDGNPIYGPYGYAGVEGGAVKQMMSGYELKDAPNNRPPFVDGFFVEDYIFTGKGDLDDHNGRFCVTPDFPKGVYAYFTSLSESLSVGGPFDNYKKPAFPYVIGNTYQSEPNNFNFLGSSNQSDYDIESNDWFRNTKNYNLNESLSGYDYIFNSNRIRKQSIDITASSVGNVENIGIFSGGNDYQYDDRLVFDSVGTGGKNVGARVERVGGKDITTISAETSSIPLVEFGYGSNRTEFIGFTSTPHNLLSEDIVNVDGLSQYFKGFNGTYKVGVRSDSLVLREDIGTSEATGLTTYFNVYGNLEFPAIRPNDILGIATERVKVLNVDTKLQRIRVLRAQDGTAGLSTFNGEVLFEDPRKFTINVGSIATTKSLPVNTELYFNPVESVGLGTTTGIGIGNTLAIVNPGAGITNIFVKPQHLYIPDHGLNLNDKVYYNINDGTSSIIGWNGTTGIGTTALSAFEFFYAAPLSKDFIGIATNKVGIGTTTIGVGAYPNALNYVGIGVTKGLFFFTDIGIGSYHSFKTSFTNTVTTQVDRTVATVSTASTHGLNRGDKIIVSVKPTDTVSVAVSYSNNSRRIIFDPVGFTSTNIDITQNTIGITSHTFKKGDKVLHTAASACGGLIDGGLYYVLPFTGDKIKLVSEKFELTEPVPSVIDITSIENGTLSKINPLVEINRNNKLIFDLSDSSLAFNVSGNINKSAFRMGLYSDDKFTQDFVTAGKNVGFAVTRSSIDVGKPGAQLTLSVLDDVPNNLWYKFSPDNLDQVPATKSEIIVDETVNSYNQINVVKSRYDGQYTVGTVGAAGDTFTYGLGTPPTKDYTSTVDVGSTPTSVSVYETDSSTVYGSINKLKILNAGSGYKNLPGIASVTSGFGTGAILFTESTNIGNIVDYKFNANCIGWDYPTDRTLRPVANLPEIVKIESLASFENIGITSVGVGYLLAPSLVVIDSYTKKKVDDVELKYDLGDTQVSIIRNTTGLYNYPPQIIPTNNTNGSKVLSVDWTQSTSIVKITFDTTFANNSDFHYAIGENILVENISVGIDSTGIGYNSSDYDYKLFAVTGVQTNAGGTGGWVEYSLDGLIGVGQTPGRMDASNSSGRVVAQKDFPSFNPTLKVNNFLVGEKVISNFQQGEVESWNALSETLKVSTSQELVVGDVIRGLTSNTQGEIKSKIDFDAEIITGAGATVVEGWQNNTGFLSDDLQRLPNNEYYQNFSYSLKSEVSMASWGNPVGSFEHAAGFDLYSDFQVVSQTDDNTPVQNRNVRVDTRGSGIEIVSHLVGKASLNCYSDFDLVSEGIIQIGSQYVSNSIDFKTRILTDYFESVGNRVLSIDDFSSSFSSFASSQKFSVAGVFGENEIFNKALVLVRDNKYTDERQFGLVTLLQYGGLGYINQYGHQNNFTVSGTLDDTQYDELGDFDFLNTSTGWHLTFSPVKYEYNTYDISSISFSILNDNSSTGIQTLGDVSRIYSGKTNIPASATTTVAAISTSYRSSSLLVQIEDTSNNFYASQLNIIHDGTNVYVNEYGALSNTTPDNSFGVGFGTYSASISGGNVEIDFIPNVAVALTANYSAVSIADTQTSIGSTLLSSGVVSSGYTSIAASGSPSAVAISSYYSAGAGSTNASYYILSVEDTTNNKYEMAEVCVLNSSSTESMIEFGNVLSGSGIGTVGISTDGDYINLNYTPNASIDVDVRLFAINSFPYDNNSYSSQINLNNSIVNSNVGVYTGTKIRVKDSFALQYKGLNIFKRNFDGSDSSVVDTTSNAVFLGEHFFITGEKITYDYPGSDTSTTNAISIASTNISGIGVTTKLPKNLFVVKESGTLKFTDTASKALSRYPTTFELSSVGIGTTHAINTVEPNKRALMAIDNMIQAPVAPTKITSGLSTDVLLEQQIGVTGFTSIFSSDLIKIDDEIMKVVHVGYAGSSQLTVLRSQLGTTLESHGIGATITKLSGNYNIVDNTVYFASAPHGQVPQSDEFALDPDNRDWTGITTSSTFQGRVFLRTAAEDTSRDVYADNYIFDDISNEFTGITSQFTLTNSGDNITGFSTFNGIVLINNIFQQPQGVQAQADAYTLEEYSGVSSVRFTDTSTTFTGYDANKTSYPRGGVIISVGSSQGFGYQPLVSAGGSAIVSTAGTIASISIGNSGSGYRSGIQSSNGAYGQISVGIQTYSAGVPNIIAIGTGAISGGHIVSIAVTNPTLLYKPRDIANVGYSSATGLTTVTTLTTHGLSQGDDIQLSGIAFTCDYSTPKTITNVGYTTTSGIMTVTTSGAHAYSVGQDVILTSIGMTCQYDTVNPSWYPRGKDYAYDNGVGIVSATSNTITVDIGYGGPGDQFTHTYTGGTVSAAVTSGGNYIHQFVNATGNAVISGGDYPHTFVSAGVGSIFVGSVDSGVITTATYATYDGGTGELVLTVVGHGLESGNLVGFDTGSLVFTCGMDSNSDDKTYPRSDDPIWVGGGTTSITEVTDNTFTVNVGKSPIVYYTPTDATYTGSTGFLELTIGSHGFSTAVSIPSVKFKDNSLNFRCSMDDYNSIHSYPRTTLDYFTPTTAAYNPTTGVVTLTIANHGFVDGDRVQLVDGALTFKCDYGVGSAHTWVGGTSTNAITITAGSVQKDITSATYDPNTGLCVMTIGSHSFTTSDTVTIGDNKLSFTCTADGNTATKTYPRVGDPAYGTALAIDAVSATTITCDVGVVSGNVSNDYPRSSDPISGKWVLVSNITTNTFEIQVLDSTPSTNTDAHTFVSALSNGVMRKRDRSYNTSVAIAATSATTITLNVGASPLVTHNVTGADYSPSTGLMKLTFDANHTLTTGTNVRIKEDSLSFTCTKDGNSTTHKYPRKPDPSYGGVGITSVPSSNTFVVNVGTSTVATYYKTGGTVQGCIIAPRTSGSTSPGGADPAAKNTQILRIVDSKTFECNTGTTTCHHYYSRSGSVKFPMEVVFDDPLSYENIPLVYSSDSTPGIGQSATVDVVVGRGSSVVSFTIDQTGVGYGSSEVLTVEVGGTTGIPTNTNLTFNEFQLNIDDVFTDKFGGWSVGELEVLDRIESQFDGYTKSFRIELSGTPVSIQAAPGSNVDVQMVLLVFINDILQEPGESYVFNGGSTLTFTTAPKSGDSSKILFYKGSGEIDVKFTDILETVKVGDKLDINVDMSQGYGSAFDEDPRMVVGINTMDSVSTNDYAGVGISSDGLIPGTLTELFRPVTWCKQQVDMIINNERIGKDRIHYEPLIYPTTNVLHNIGVGTYFVYVDSLRPLFDSNNEAAIRAFQDSIVIDSQDVVIGASATATVSVAGTVSAITVTDGGYGYSSTPTVTIADPVGLGTTGGATATATLSSGLIDSVTVSYGGSTTGTAYTTSSPPVVLISPPTLIKEKINVSSYSGDYGTVVGFGTTTSGPQNRLYFDLWIPLDSYMRDADYVGSAVTISTINVGDYFTIYNTNVSSGLSTFASQTYQTAVSVGIATTCVDDVYQVYSAETRELPSEVLGFSTYVRRIFTNVDRVGSGIAYTTSYQNELPSLGEFSWGKIILDNSPSKVYNFYGDNGISGISTSALVTRYEPLKYNNYT